MMKSDTIRYLEECSLNAWPALQTVLYDGWILRFANGYSKRANSINPLYSFEATIDLESKLAHCEVMYAKKQLRPVFKITPQGSFEQLDDLLANHGYVVQDETSLQTVNLDQIPEPYYMEVQREHGVTQQWINEFCRISKSSVADQATMFQMLQQIQPDTYFLTLRYDGHVAAVGFAVVERGYVGIFDIITDEAYRNKGLGKELVLHLLHCGKQKGASQGYLQVVTANLAAQRLYAKLGFQEEYRYWYRVKERMY